MNSVLLTVIRSSVIMLIVIILCAIMLPLSLTMRIDFILSFAKLSVTMLSDIML
jgi:hypothetical protein